MIRIDLKNLKTKPPYTIYVADKTGKNTTMLEYVPIEKDFIDIELPEIFENEELILVSFIDIFNEIENRLIRI